MALDSLCGLALWIALNQSSSSRGGLLHDILATLDVCASIHATKQCDDKGYDIMYAYMVKGIQENEELGMGSTQCDKELILEGPKIDNSKIDLIVKEDTMQNIPLMSMKMEIMSIKDFKVQ